MFVNMYAFSYTDSGITKYAYSNYIPEASSRSLYLLQNGKMMYSGGILSSGGVYRLSFANSQTFDGTRAPDKDGVYEIGTNGIYNKDLNLYVVGNPTISPGKILSNCTSVDYVNFYKELDCDISQAEFVVKFSFMGNDWSGAKNITAGMPFDTFWSLSVNGDSISIYSSYTGVNNDLINTTVQLPNVNTEGENIFFVKYTYDKATGKHRVFCREQSTTVWTSIFEVNNFYPPIFTGYTNFGNDGGDSFNRPFTSGNIYLAETYIKINGELWWSPYSDSIEEKKSNFTDNMINAGVRAPLFLGNTLTKVPQNVSPYITIDDTGTMTFKRGMITYIPNGRDADGHLKFDKAELNSDVIAIYGTAFNDLCWCKTSYNSFFATLKVNLVVSNTEPSMEGSNARFIWYDTANNIIKTKLATATTDWVSGLSLPFCIVNCYEVNKFRDLRCFDYCGYMDSMVYTFPGIEGYIASGLDSNGNPLNRKITTNTVYTYTNPGSAANDKVKCNIGVNETNALRMSANVRPYISYDENQPENNIFYYPPKNLLERNFNKGGGKGVVLESIDYLYINADFNYKDSKVTVLNTYPLSTQFKNYNIVSGTNKLYTITKYPHYIDLEVKDKTLTIKKGSVIWYPDGKNEDGTNKFNSKIFNEDYILEINWTTELYNNLWASFEINRSAINLHQGFIYSSDTRPSDTKASFWYDTANNYIYKINAGNDETYNFSFPLAILTYCNEELNVQQVFDWYSFIGNCIVTYPGLEGYSPKGLDSNGNKLFIKKKQEVLCIKQGEPSKNYTHLISNLSGVNETSTWLYERETDPAASKVVRFSRYYNTKTNTIRFLNSENVWQDQGGNYIYIPLLVARSSVNTSLYRSVLPIPTQFKQNFTNGNIQGNKLLYYPKNVSPYVYVGKIPLYAYKLADNLYIYLATLLKGGLKASDVVSHIPFYDRNGNLIRNYTFLSYNSSGEDPSNVTLTVKDATNNTTYTAVYDSGKNTKAQGILVKSGCKYYIPFGVPSFPDIPVFIEKTTQFDMGICNISNGQNSALVCILSGFLDAYPQANIKWGTSGQTVDDTINRVYNTTSNNIQYRYGVNQWRNLLGKYSLPIGSISVLNTFPESFSPFDYLGYVGNTIFCLPSTTVSTYNGLDGGGRHYNPITSTPSILRFNNTESVTAGLPIPVRVLVDIQNSYDYGLGHGTVNYDESTNYFYVGNSVRTVTLIGDVVYESSGKPTSITPYPMTNYYNYGYVKKSKYLGNTLIKTPANISPYLSIRQVNGNPELTLKAGAKLYFPAGKNEDGTNKFEEVILPHDIVRNSWNSTFSGIIQVDYNGSLYSFARNGYDTINNVYYVVSGDTQPTTGRSVYWYDTANNVFKVHNTTDDTWRTIKSSLPIMFIDSSKGESLLYNSLGTVFDWLGFCGSTVFCLPGLEGYQCNGKDSSGNPVNIYRTTNKVLTFNSSSDNALSSGTIISNESTISEIDSLSLTGNKYFTVDTLPENPIAWSPYYVTSLNQLQRYSNSTNTWRIQNALVLGLESRIQGGQITSVTPKKLG